MLRRGTPTTSSRTTPRTRASRCGSRPTRTRPPTATLRADAARTPRASPGTPWAAPSWRWRSPRTPPCTPTPCTTFSDKLGPSGARGSPGRHCPAQRNPLSRGAGAPAGHPRRPWGRPLELLARRWRGGGGGRGAFALLEGLAAGAHTVEVAGQATTVQLPDAAAAFAPAAGTSPPAVNAEGRSSSAGPSGVRRHTVGLPRQRAAAGAGARRGGLGGGRPGGAGLRHPWLCTQGTSVDGSQLGWWCLWAPSESFARQLPSFSPAVSLFNH